MVASRSRGRFVNNMMLCRYTASELPTGGIWGLKTVNL